MLQGIDVSRHQLRTPSLVGVDFLIARACYGAELDAMFARHVAAAKAAGIPIGAYLFLRSSGVAAQVAELLAAIASVGGVDGVAVDLEGDRSSPPATNGEAAAALELIEAHGWQGRDPGSEFTAAGLYASTGRPYPSLGQAWRWVADYRPLPEPPIQWDIWQWTSSAGGLSLDRDRFDGTRAELLELWRYGALSDIEVTATTPMLVDLVPSASKAIEILEPTGDVVRRKLTAPRLGVLSPLGSVSAGGTSIRLIVYTGAAAGGSILLAVYANDCSNVRPATPDAHAAAKAAGELVAKAAADAADKI